VLPGITWHRWLRAGRLALRLRQDGATLCRRPDLPTVWQTDNPLPDDKRHLRLRPIGSENLAQLLFQVKDSTLAENVSGEAVNFFRVLPCNLSKGETSSATKPLVPVGGPLQPLEGQNSFCIPWRTYQTNIEVLNLQPLLATP